PRLWLAAPFGALAAVLLVRAGTGDLDSGIGPLLLVPILAVSGFGSRRALVAMMAAVLAVTVVVGLYVADDEVLKSVWRDDFILLVVGGVLAFAIQDLVGRIRREQALADARSRSIAALSEMTRNMATSTDGAHILCSLIAENTGAVGVAILELDEKKGWRPIAGLGTGPNGRPVAEPGSDSSPWRELKRGTRWRTVSADPDFADFASNWASPEIESIVWQPIVDQDRVAGALAIAWEEAGPDPGRAPLPLDALASEALVAVQQVRLNEQLKTQARTDPLTGIDNRRAWEAEVRRSLARARRSGGPLSIALIDLDDFKAFNDSHGHPEGDRLLRDTVEAWKYLLRTEDHLARYGGDEFMLTLPDTDIERAGMATERLRAAVPRGQTCSAGVACLEPGDSLEQLVKRADEALYREKSRRIPEKREKTVPE
ncbi:MAG: GGDEF domain-containing protein, partial [Acidobacteriota bacterium]